MDNWFLKYDKVEKNIIIDEPNLVRVTIGSKIGFCDTNGNEIIPCKYRYHGYRFYSDILEVVDDRGKIGFVNRRGIEVIECRYDKVSDIEDDLICVCKCGDIKDIWGVIDTSGQEIIPMKYHFLGHLGRGRLIAQNDHGVGCLDYRDNVVIPFEYYQLGRVTTNNRIEYSKGSGKGLERGYLDLNGNVVEILY